MGMEKMQVVRLVLLVSVFVGETVGVTVGGGGMVVGRVIRCNKGLGFCFFPFFE